MEDEIECPIWVEKYRPNTFEDLVGNTEIIESLHKAVDTGDFPQFILSGPPGCGKTSAVQVVARNYLKDSYEIGCIELNASDERKLEDVRERLQGFCQQNRNLPANKLKIAILEETDNMPCLTQNALRRLMELYSFSTRFMITCNDPENIIEAIQSRSTILRFSSICSEDLHSRLLHILKAEECAFDESGIDSVIQTSSGDLRQVINNAQSTIVAFDILNAQNVQKIVDMPNRLVLDNTLDAIMMKDWQKAYYHLNDICKAGYNYQDIILGLGEAVESREMGSACDRNESMFLAWYSALDKAFIRCEQGGNMLTLDAMLCEMIVGVKGD